MHEEMKGFGQKTIFRWNPAKTTGGGGEATRNKKSHFWKKRLLNIIKLWWKMGWRNAQFLQISTIAKVIVLNHPSTTPNLKIVNPFVVWLKFWDSKFSHVLKLFTLEKCCRNGYGSISSYSKSWPTRPEGCK